MPTLPLHHVESLSRYNSAFRATRDEQPQEYNSQFLLNALLASLAGGVLLYLVQRNSDYLMTSSARIYNRLCSLFTPGQRPADPVVPPDAVSTPSVNEVTSVKPVEQAETSEHQIIPAASADDAAESNRPDSEENPDDFEKDAESDFSAVPAADSEEVKSTMRQRK